MLPASLSDDVVNASNTPHTRLFVASPTLPTLQSPRRGSTSPSWCRLPFAAVCSCGQRGDTGVVDTDSCCGEPGRRQLELGRLSPSVACVPPPPPPAECRRLSADDVSELSGGALVDTSSTLNDPHRRRRTIDKPIYLPLGRAPSSDHDRTTSTAAPSTMITRSSPTDDCTIIPICCLSVDRSF